MQLLRKQWFLLGLTMCVSVGLTATNELEPIAKSTILRQSLVFLTMLAMSLPLRLGQLWETIREPRAAIVAVFGNLVIVPFLAYILRFFLPEAFGTGLMVASVVPCTIASAAVLAQRGGGDPMVAILTTLVTNLLCFLYIPLALTWIFNASSQFDDEFWKSAMQLAGLVVLPIMLGQLLSISGKIARFAERRRNFLAICSQIGILCMVLLGAIQTGVRWRTAGAEELSILPLLSVCLAVLVVHLLAMAIVWNTAKLLGISRPQAIGATLAGSQKTLMVGLQIAIDMGVSILPMIAYHIGQLFVDTVIADYWKKRSNDGE